MASGQAGLRIIAVKKNCEQWRSLPGIDYSEAKSVRQTGKNFCLTKPDSDLLSGEELNSCSHCEQFLGLSAVSTMKLIQRTPRQAIIRQPARHRLFRCKECEADGRATFPRLLNWQYNCHCCFAGRFAKLSFEPALSLPKGSKESGNDFILCKWFGLISF